MKYLTGAAAVIIAVMFLGNLQKEGMVWETYSEERFQEAVAQGQPVIMDFYADWCIPCLELDRLTFTHNDVIQATEHMARLKVDLTHFDSPEAEQLRREYSVAGVPSIVFIDETGEEVRQARVVGFMNAAEFIHRIEMVNPKSIVSGKE